MKEEVVSNYFKMWVDRDFTKLDNIFCDRIYYRECYGATYVGLDEIHMWINDMLLKQTVLKWDIKNCYNLDNSTIFVEWIFQAKETETYIFDGISTIKFQNNKIISIEEYETKHNTFRPYKIQKG